MRAPDDYKAIWKVMNAVLNGSVDIMTQHAACLFYVPSQVHGADNEMFMTDGREIDVDHYIELGREIIDSTQTKYPAIPRSPRTYATPIDLAGFVTYDPELTTLELSPYAMQAYIDEYLNLPRGAHYLGLYTFMTRVAGHAKSRNTIVSVRHLTLLAQQLDRLDGGYYANRPIQTEAENVVRFVYGGVA